MEKDQKFIRGSTWTGFCVNVDTALGEGWRVIPYTQFQVIVPVGGNSTVSYFGVFMERAPQAPLEPVSA